VEASGEKRVSLKEQRQLFRLWQFRHDLPEGWKVKYERWVQKHGEPEHPDFSYYMSSGWTGPTSPKSSVNIQEMSVTKIVDYLKTWIPPEGHCVDTPEGLGRSITQAVANDPIRFASDAVLFIGLDPTYVRGLIEGFRDVPKNRDDFPWQPVLELFQWVVEQPREISGRKSEYSDLDPGWVWARKSIASLLSTSLNECPGQIPFNV